MRKNPLTQEAKARAIFLRTLRTTLRMTKTHWGRELNLSAESIWKRENHVVPWLPNDIDAVRCLLLRISADASTAADLIEQWTKEPSCIRTTPTAP